MRDCDTCGRKSANHKWITVHNAGVLLLYSLGHTVRWGRCREEGEEYDGTAPQAIGQQTNSENTELWWIWCDSIGEVAPEIFWDYEAPENPCSEDFMREISS